MAEVAKGLGLAAAGVVTLSRTATEVPPPLLKAAFSAPRPAGGKPTAGTAILPGGDVAVFVVNSVTSGTLPMTPDSAAQMSQIAQRAAGQLAGAEFGAYVDELVRTAKVTVNEKVFE
jgi:peptidyl-prolyl cis-trans isomerase D